MHRISRLFVCLLAAAFSLASALPSRAQSSNNFVPGELLIGFESEADRDSLANLIDRTRETLRAGGQSPAGLVVEKRGETSMKLVIDFPESVKTRLRNDPGAERALLEELARQLRENNPKIRYAHPNWILSMDLPQTVPPPDTQATLQGGTVDQTEIQRASPPNDPLFQSGLHWHYLPLPVGMNAVGAWAQTTGSRDVVVAVVDSGIVRSHVDFGASSNLARGHNFVSWDGCVNQRLQRSTDPTDPGDACPEKNRPNPSWHGTHVAGTVGAVASNNGQGVAGVAWNVTVLPVRVMGRAGSGTTADITDGIRWAVGLPVAGAPPVPRRADIINLSLGGTGECSGEFMDAVAAARRAGATVVVAAGNLAKDVSGFYPANCPGVISVAAGDVSGAITHYSNFGAVTVMAPGGDVRYGRDFRLFGRVQRLSLGIWSIGTDGNYLGMDGTSMAAPHVSGAIALAMSKNPQLRGKPDLVLQRVRASTVRPLPGACPPERPCGGGQFDAARLLSQ